MGFTTLAQTLEIQGRRCDQSITFVHDEVPFLHETYQFYQNLARDGGTLAPHSEFFERAGCPGLIKHVSAPEFRDSTTEPLVEAADVLVGMVAKLMTIINGKGSWNANQTPLAALLLGGFVEPELRASSLFNFVGSDATGSQMGQAVFGALSRVSAG